MAVIEQNTRIRRHRPPLQAARALPRIGTPATPVETHALAFPVKVYLVTVMLPIAFFVGPVYMTPLRLLLLIAIVPLIVRLFRGQFGPLIPTDFLFIGHIFWAAVSFSINHPDSVVQHIGSSGVEFLGSYLLARAYIRNHGQFYTLCKVLGVMICLTLPLAFLETQTNRPLLIDIVRSLPVVRAPEVIDYEQRMGLYRAQVVFAHPILYGVFCSIGFALTLGALKGQIGNRRRYLVSALVALCTFLSLSSGAILAVAIQLMLMAWYWAFRKIEWRWLLLLGIFAICYIVIDVLSNRTPMRVFMSYATFSAHNAFWRGLINEWGMMNIFGSVENGIPPAPWFGIGDHGWVRPAFMHSASVDNFWLWQAMRYGVPGFLLLAGGYAIAMWKIARRNFRNDADLETIRRIWIFTFAGVTFSLITVHIWTSLYSFVFFMFGAGIWLYNAQPKDGKEADIPDADVAPASPYTRFPTTPQRAPARKRRPA